LGGNGGEDFYLFDLDFECVYVVIGSFVVMNELGDIELGVGDVMMFFVC